MIKKLMNFLNKVPRFITMALIALVILPLIIGVYGTFKVKWAKKQVEAFNQQVVIGMPVGGLEKKAKALKLNYRLETDSNDKNGRFFVWEGFVFSRWFCEVEYRDGKAASKKVTFLD